MGRPKQLRARTRGQAPTSPLAHFTPNVLRTQPTRTILAWTPEDYSVAVRLADGGNISKAADLAAEIMKDGRVRGAYEQASAMLGIPPRFEGASPELAALLESDMPDIFPEAEQDALWRWGFHFGRGWARKSHAWDPVTRGFSTRVETWHARWFSMRREPDANGNIVDVWYVQTATGSQRVTAGNGWIAFAPYGEKDAVAKGLWNGLAVPYLAKWQSIQDRTRTSEVTPIIVGMTQGLSEPQRAQFLADLRLSQDTRMVLPKGCDVKAVDVSSGVRGGIQKDTIEWADGEISTIILGQSVTTDGSSGFSNGDVQLGAQEAITRKRETAWSTCLGEQLVTPHARLAYGWHGPTIYPRWIGSTNMAAEAPEEPQGAPVAAVAPAPPKAAPDAVAPPVLASMSDDATDAEVERFAAEMTEAKVTHCEHGKRNRCETCGLERVRSVTRGAPTEDHPDGEPVWAIQWRPIRSATLSRAASATGRGARRLTRTIAIGDEPPERFVLFTWGENESSKGSVWLTDLSAAEVMAEFGSRELMIDLEHRSLDPESRAYDPDARGWARLELTDVGLEAVDVRWTDDGERRIRGKLQRYTSPAFDTDENGAVISVCNVALTAIPATRFIQPLVAASATSKTPATRSKNMDEKQAIQFMMLLAGLAPDAPLEELVGKVREKFTGEPAAAEVPDVDPAMASDVPEEEDPAAAMTSLRSKLGVKTNGEALAAVSGLRQAAKSATLALSRVEALEKRGEESERATLLTEHRTKFSADAFAWAKTAPIGEVRQFVRFAAPAVDTSVVTPPTRGAPEISESTKRKLDARKIDHAAFAAKRGEIVARSRRSTQEAG